MKFYFTLWICLSVACSSDKDSGIDIEAACSGGGETDLTIGFGAGGAFNEFEQGAAVGLSPAPQGGFGVWVRAKTSGIKAMAEDGSPHATSQVLLETYIEGQLVGSFLNESVEVYCQDDGAGLLWDVAVGFDPEQYSTNEDLLSLEGQETELRVLATDEDGNTAEGRIDVVIALGQ